MERIDKHETEDLSFWVTLFRDDLEYFEELSDELDYPEWDSEFSIEAGEYRFESVEELANNAPKLIHAIEFRYGPLLRLGIGTSLIPFLGTRNIHMSRYLSDIKADGVARRIAERLRERRRSWIVQTISNRLLTLAAFALLLFLKLIGLRPLQGFQDSVGLSIATVLAGVWFVWTWALRMKQKIFVQERKVEVSGFFQRNRDDLITRLVSGVVGAIVGSLVTFLVTFFVLGKTG